MRLSSAFLLASLALITACAKESALSPGEEEGAGAPGSDAAVESPREIGETANLYQPVRARALTVEAIGACREGDFLRGRDLLRQASQHRPGQVEIWMLLAGIEHRLGDEEAAGRALERIVAIGLEPPFERAPFYDTLIDDPLHTATVEALAGKVGPVEVSQAHVRLEDRDLIPEGIAFDPLTGAFFLSSVRRRTIIQVENGEPTRRLEEGTLWSVLGLAVDAERRLLWATTAALPQMQDYDESFENRSALVAFELGDGESGGDAAGDSMEEARRFELPTDRPHTLNDLALAADGTVFVSDNRVPGLIYRVLPGGESLEALLPEGFFRSPQGLALSDDQKRLYVADYSLGLTALDLDGAWLASGERYLSPPDDFCLTGIDGLAAAGVDERGRDVLIAIQNLYQPHRVLRLTIDEKGQRVSEAEVLEQARSDYSEPTLGTVVDGDFYYVANSQWNRFDPSAQLPPLEELERPLMLRLPL